MLHLFHPNVTLVTLRCQIFLEEGIMDITRKRIIILMIVIIVAAILGRLAVRAVLNLILGGTMFGGNIL